ncbi:MAG TPA: hypothetical protein VEA69_03805 [Tepidisphaeraceae bacterium]|nr:hypothetical protein [Tepidisphaeraceae bacterium]
MPVIELMKSEAASVRLTGVRTGDGPFVVGGLEVLIGGAVKSKLVVAGPGAEVPAKFLEPTGAGDAYRLKRAVDAGLTLGADFAFDAAAHAGDPEFFGVAFSATGGVSAAVVVRLTAEADAAAVEAEAYLELRCRGQVQVGLTTGGDRRYAGAAVEFTVVVDAMVRGELPSPPVLFVRPPGDLPWPRVRIPWPDFPVLRPFPLQIPGFSVELPGLPIRFGCERILIDVDADLARARAAVLVTVDRFRLDGVGGSLTGTITVVADPTTGEQAIDPARTKIDQFEGAIPDLRFRTLDPGVFGFDWRKASPGALLALFGHDLPAPKVEVDTDEFRLRVHGGPGGVDEIRLDWVLGDNARELPLPGVTVGVDAPDMLTFLLRRDSADGDDDGRPVRLTGIATFPPDKGLTIRTSFALPNFGGDADAEREVMRDAKGTDEPALSIKATAKHRLSVAVFDFPVGPGRGKPRYFQKVTPALTPLSVQETEAGAEVPTGVGDEFDFVKGLFEPAARTPVRLGKVAIDGDAKDVDIALATGLDQVRLPALHVPGGREAQWLDVRVTNVALGKDPDSGDPAVVCDVDVTVSIGSMKFTGQIHPVFDLERMAFKVKADEGIRIGLGKLVEDEQFLGLSWTFEDAPAPDPNSKKLEPAAFVLVVKDRNFQLRQVPGATITVAYDRATMPGDRILFTVRDFALTPNGIDASAEIRPDPARLNGLETQFQFTGGSFRVDGNRIRAFSIEGSGPLPPDLVGEATADVCLAFEQDEAPGTAVRLKKAEVRVWAPRLLKCSGTHFDLQVDGLGMDFESDAAGADNLYFLVSGKARYRLQGEDAADGPLGWLPAIEVELNECPLTKNMRAFSKGLKFLVPLQKKVQFSFLGCFKFELRAIGFVPQFDKLGKTTAAMQLSGQIMFADTGDLIEAKVDFHDLYVALPEPGRFVPRLYCKGLGVRIAQGDAFVLEAAVDFYNGEEIEYNGEESETGIRAYGFVGEGSVTIKGLPPIAASTAWLRASADGGVSWKRCWFLYLEARRMSLRIPVLEIYIREIGFGFGYRYTLASIKEADETTDTRKLLKRLKELSRTQGNLSKREQWRLDLEGPSEDARWTIVLRALFASSSAQTAPFTGYDDATEAVLPSLYVMDAVLAVRSDLTFFLAGRAWLNTNYHDFHKSVIGKGEPANLHEQPLLSGFALLSPRQRRFLANLSSNPNAEFGDHPPFPGFLKTALRQSQFTATLLIEPGLVHYELGWPNQLRWRAKVGPLTAEFMGGTIFRLSTRELVVGNSFLARGRLEIAAEFSAGFFGAGLYALADVAYGARYIGVLSFVNPLANSAFYGAVGLDIRVHVEIRFWLRIKIGWFKISINLSLSFQLQFTAALQVGITLPEVAGVLGTATVSVGIMGRRCGFNIRVGINDGAVEAARRKTERFLNIGLEATEVEAVPGVEGPKSDAASLAGGGEAVAPALAGEAVAPAAVGAGEDADAPVDAPAAIVAGPTPAEPGTAAPPAPGAGTSGDPPDEFHTPDYVLGQAQAVDRADSARGEQMLYFLLMPGAQSTEHDGFFAVPPDDGATPVADFRWNAQVPTGVALEQWVATPGGGGAFRTPEYGNAGTGADAAIVWKVPWDDEINGEFRPAVPGDVAPPPPPKLRDLFRYAYRHSPFGEADTRTDARFGDVTVLGDPYTHWVPTDRSLEDDRVQNPTEGAFEAAVRGAAEQFAAPYFRFDPNSAYDRNLREAFRPDTSVYTRDGKRPPAPGKTDDAPNDAPTPSQAASEMRGSLIQAIVRDFFRYVDLVGRTDDAAKAERRRLEHGDPAAGIAPSLAFRLGLVFRVRQLDDTPDHPGRAWVNDGDLGSIRQREAPDQDNVGPNAGQVRTFNRRQDWFGARPPEFSKVRTYAHANTVAIDWRLDFPGSVRDAVVDDPQQHLRHYHVRREHLDGNDPTAEFTLKPAEVLHRDASGAVLRLPPRFQFVDHFNDEVGGDVAALTAAGKTYLYTVTPIDVAGTPSRRPLSVVATRFPADPPLVPTDGELVVRYAIPADPRSLFPADPTARPAAGEPARITVRFTDPVDPAGRPPVAVERHWLVLRRQPTIPVGFYGADEDARGAEARGLAVSNARRLRTDIALLLKPEYDARDRAATGRRVRVAQIALADLRAAGVFPDDGAWRPEGWTAFLQTESVGGAVRDTADPTAPDTGAAPVRAGVPSALAPVSVRLEFAAPGAPPDTPAAEDRQFTRLEWLPRPVRLDLLPSTDTAGEVGFAKVPMPALDRPDAWALSVPAADDAPVIPGVAFEQHPARTRAVRLAWNQGPSAPAAHPIELHARYQVYEFDALATPGDRLDAPGATVHFDRWADGASLRKVQEVDLVPAGEIADVPGEATDPQRWEAWYPSSTRRLMLGRARRDAAPGARGAPPARDDGRLVPWFSFRDSYLEWPNPDGLTDPAGKRLGAFHPFLEDVAALLARAPAGDPFPPVTVEAGPQPARGGDQSRENVTDPNAPVNRSAPSGLDLFLKGTAPENDPYGWGVLQRMGLSTGVRVRDRATGRYMHGAPLVRRIGRAVELQKTKFVGTLAGVPQPTKETASALRIRAGAAGQCVRVSADGRGPVVTLPDPPEGQTHGPEYVVDRLDPDATGAMVIEVWGATEATKPQVTASTGVTVGELGEDLPARRDAAGHFHLEHLFQPGRRTAIAPAEDAPAGPAEFDATLSLVQLSLRPAVRQALRYNVRTATGLVPGTPVTVTVEVTGAPARNFASYVHATGAPAEPRGFPSDKFVVMLPASREGELVIVLRAVDPSDAVIKLTGTRRDGSADVAVPFEAGKFRAPTDDVSTYFAVDPDAVLPAATETAAGAAWARFERLLRTAEPAVAPSLPITKDPQSGWPQSAFRLLAWLDRFFGSGGDVQPVADGSAFARTPAVNWIATGYPRAAWPLPLTPDRAGRLTYFRPVEDLWAHAYRYYVRPRGRYELLWEEIGRSRRLIDEDQRGRVEEWQRTIAAPRPGGADVAMGRIRPLASPLVISSRRLDAPAKVGTASTPSDTWEVLVARHPEQVLIERNRSLAHYLEFRQLAQAMFRTVWFWRRGANPLPQFFGRAATRLYAAADRPLAGPDVTTLFLVGAATTEHPITIPALATVAQVADLINALPTEVDVRAAVEAVPAGGSDDASGRAGVVLALTAGTAARPSDIRLRTRSGDDSTNLVSAPDDVRDADLDWPTTVPDAEAALPAIPAAPRHVDLGPGADAAGLVRFDLPLRSTQFTNGAVAVQYASPPFFYAHRVLVIAQAAGVVSPITAVEHRAFAYVTPDASARMEGAEADDGGRYRRIVIDLARLWDSVPPAVRDQWPAEAPDTLAPSVRRRPASLPDPEVVYAVVVSKPDSGNVEVVAEYRFDPDDAAAAPAGYAAAKFAGPFRGAAVRVNAPGSIAGTGAPRVANVDRPTLETVLLPADRTGPATEVSAVAVSDRAAFADGAPAALLRWPAAPETLPRACAVRLVAADGPTDDVQWVGAIRELIPAVDVSLADALRSLLAQDGPNRYAQACVGPDQLAQIHGRVTVAPAYAPGSTVEPGGGRITWVGPATGAQIDVLRTEWQTSLYARTFAALADALAAVTVGSAEFVATALTQAQVDAAGLGARVKIVTGSTADAAVASWVAPLLSPAPTDAELAALDALIEPVSPDPAKAALLAFRAEVAKLPDRPTEVSIIESFWQPRPGQDDLPPALRDRLLIGRGVIGFRGLMTLAEGQQLLAVPGLKPPDRRSVRELFDRAANSGLGGGRLRLVARRGSAGQRGFPIVAALPES